LSFRLGFGSLAVRLGLFNLIVLHKCSVRLNKTPVSPFATRGYND
jgi:hypothetical protein